MKVSLILLFLLLGIFGWWWTQRFLVTNHLSTNSKTATPILSSQALPVPLSIAAMRSRTYPGSDIIIEQKLSPGTNYDQYLTSYQSDGLKIYALLTVPRGQKPVSGWPVILFNHGYIPPEVYCTTERYVAYVDALARSGYIVFKPDFRGNGLSQGEPEGAYYSPAYTIDDLNALASIKRYKDANPNRIGVWGHSMGGNVTLRDLVVRPRDFQAAVIWGGVVGNYNDLMNNWQRRVVYHPSPSELALRNRSRQQLVDQYGTPQTNPSFWQSIDPTSFLSDIDTPLQLDVGGSDEEVPVDFSRQLRNSLQQSGKTVEYYEYPGDNHNISHHFSQAMRQTIAFFDRYLKP